MKFALKSFTNWGLAFSALTPISALDPNVSQAISQLVTLIAPSVGADPQALTQTVLAVVSLIGVLVSLWGRWRIGDLYLLRRSDDQE